MNRESAHLTLMPTLAAIHERRAVRSYTAEQVTGAHVDLLLDAAVSAPSSMNTQPWAFVVLQDAALLERYESEAVESFTSDPAPAEVAALPTDELEVLRALLASPEFTIFHGAPTALVIYATRPTGVPDCFLAAENVMLAACALGLGTCPIGLAVPLFNTSAVKDELGVPSEFVVALPIAIGVPSGPTHAPDRRPPHVLARR